MGEPPAAVRIDCFTDLLCIWAYVAEIKLDELRRQFNDRVAIHPHFIPLFGDTREKLARGWAERGGAAAYGRHVLEVAARFPHVEVHPEIWTRNVPPSSGSAHLYLKAVEVLQENGDLAAGPRPEYQGRSLVEELASRLRRAFFRDLRNIAETGCLAEVAGELGLPTASIRACIDDGSAFAALCRDLELRERQHIVGSPTYVLNEGRQILYGNVGYRIIEANVEELLEDNRDRASWC